MFQLKIHLNKNNCPNYEKIKYILNESPDLMCRTLEVGGDCLEVIFMKNLIKHEFLNEYVIKYIQQLPIEYITFSYLLKNIPMDEVKTNFDEQEVISSLLKGFVYIYLSVESKAFMVNCTNPIERSIEKAETESLVYGPKISFTESLTSNIKIIRQNLKDSNLCTDELEIGERAKKQVRIIYIKDIADDDILKTLKERFEKIKTDDISDSSVLAQCLEDNHYSFFPQFILTELPDRFLYSILNGRIGVLIDRSPVAIIGPANFLSFFESTEDIYLRWSLSTFIRFVRLFAMVGSLLFTAFYVATITYHFELIPSKLLIIIGQSRSQVPFPPLLEALLLEFLIELLREAGARLPSKVGQTMGIVGGIVIGQATVEAGLTSNILIIIVAFSALGAFMAPIYEMGTAIRVARFPFIILAGIWGLNGIIIGVCVLMVHLLKLTSLNKPYLAPLYPFRIEDLKYFLIRLPHHFYMKRPIVNRPLNAIRTRWKSKKTEKDLDEF
ncbi:spore germination protein [Neobacillus sp. MER 74]|uniref:spore germination protein n=1 Tax=Bacillaceae TaxID=186817 RepID=UPI000BF42CAF|nr:MULTISPECIES: spore germination protein [Bacillaceae]MCM3113829.1 spore germination protein [Neobacillus sp. MER 74]PFP30187.1 spore germination protein [Bacillus sp. AFS073361]